MVGVDMSVKIILSLMFGGVRRVLHLTWQMKDREDSWVVVGHDRRYRGEYFAAAVAEVLAGNGLKSI